MENITSEYIKNTKKSINEYLELIFKDKKNQRISNKLLEAYVEARYYNYVEEGPIKQMIDSYIKEESKKIDGDKELINLYVNVFSQMVYIDGYTEMSTLKEKINTLNNYRIQKLGIVEKNFKDNMLKLINIHNTKRDKLLNNLQSEAFLVEYKKIGKKKNLFNVTMKHQIKFNPLYSEYAINNAFKTGMVNENRMIILYSIYSAEMITNIIKCDFKKHYLIDFDENLFSKSKKLQGILNILDLDPIKDMTSFKITYTNFLEYKNDIYDLKRKGFNFSVIIDSKYVDDDVNFTKLQLFKYVIIENAEYRYDSILKQNNCIMM